MSEQNQQLPEKPTEKKMHPVRALFEDPGIKKATADLLGKRAPQFVSSIMQLLSSNAMLKVAEPNSIYQAAIIAATLDLPINNSLGMAYLVPYKNNGIVQAQFQIGYKGLVQLAQRSGLYKSIGCCEVYEGQLIKNDPLFGPEFNWEAKQIDGGIIGYAAQFSLLNGFYKADFWPVEKVQRHAKRYSKSVNNGPWVTNFDGMAMKTVLKLLIQKYGPMSIELQQAVEADQAVVTEEGAFEYVDNPDGRPADINKEAERIQMLIEDSATLEQLMRFKDLAQSPELLEVYETKFALLLENSN